MTLFAGNPKREVVLIKIEATEGTDPTPDATNYVTLESFSMAPASEPIQRTIVGAEQGGTPALQTSEHLKPTGSKMITMQTISSANDDDAPVDTDVILRASGWQRESEASTNTHTYCLITGQGESATIYHYVNNADASAGLLTQANGCRGNCEIKFEAGKPWMIDGISWIGTQPQPTEPTQDGSAFTTDYQQDDDTIMLGVHAGTNGTWRLYDPVADALYGGGTLATPGTDGDLVSFTLGPNRNEAPRRASGFQGGIGGSFNGNGQPQLTLVVECNNFDAINLQQARANHTPLEFLVTSPQPGASGNVITFLCYVSIREIDPNTVGENVLHCTLTCDLLYPPDVSDNDPPAGVQPFSTATTATNRGLPVVPAGGLPNSVAWLQFRTIV